jgi:hypothetical protein
MGFLVFMPRTSYTITYTNGLQYHNIDENWLVFLITNKTSMNRLTSFINSSKTGWFNLKIWKILIFFEN